MKDSWVLYGSELSPFHLKLVAILKAKKIPFREFPREASTVENIKILLRLKLLRIGLLKLSYPDFTEYDEFPLVPFLFGPKKQILYDSSAIAIWLDLHTDADIIVQVGADKKLHFLIQLIDEYFDEFGLYMVHHNRWKISARDNTAGRRLANEMPKAVAPFRSIIAKYFSHRQTRRLPYLFSVAPKGYCIDSLSTQQQPPSHHDFPATHNFLEQSYLNVLNALEPIFQSRPFLFGDQFTVADASLYGQLSMNLSDPSAAKLIKETAPNVFTWLNKIHQGDFSANKPGSKLIIDDLLKPLLSEIVRLFFPLMQQNEAAYQRQKDKGETLFNEAAFWRGKSIYRGELDGHPFANVAKSFQVKIWRQIEQSWQQLAPKDKADLCEQFVGLSIIN